VVAACRNRTGDEPGDERGGAALAEQGIVPACGEFIAGADVEGLIAQETALPIQKKMRETPVSRVFPTSG